MSDHDDFMTRILRPQLRQNQEQRVYGLVTGRVTRIEDDGTYRLRLFGMNDGQDDEDSAPARVMTPMAGGGRGVHFLPEPGDEVVVGFHGGDTNHPIILGAVWNRNDRPPAQAHASPENNVRTIVSRSGHELTFDDTSRAERVTLRTHGRHTVVLDDTAGRPTVTISTDGRRTVVLDDTLPGRISIETPTCRIILNDAGGTLTLQASSAITLVAPSVTMNGGGGTLDLRAAAINLDASSIALNGASVTVGTAPGASVTIGSAPGASVIDGIPFAPHIHPITSPATTGPAAPGGAP